MRPQAGLSSLDLQAFRCLIPLMKINKVPKYVVEELKAVVNAPSVHCLRNEMRSTMFFSGLLHTGQVRRLTGDLLSEGTFLPLLVMTSLPQESRGR